MPRTAEATAPPAAAGRTLMLRYALLTAADLGGKVLAYVVSVVVIRDFGADGFGALGLAAAVVACALTVGTFGLDLYGLRAAARHPERLPTTIPTVVILRLTIAAAVYPALVGVTAAVPSLRPVAPLVVILGASLFVGSVSLNWVAEGLQRAPVLAAASVGTQAVLLAVLFGLGPARDALWVVAAAQVGAELAVAAGVLAWGRSAFRGRWAAAPRAEWRGVLREAAPMGWTRVLRAATVTSDVLILGLLLPLAEVGWYTGAYRLYTLFLASVGLYSILLLSRLSRCAGAGEAAVWHEVRASFRRILPPAVVAAAAAAAAAGHLLAGLFDPSFATATRALRLLLLGLLVGLVSGHYRLALVALGRPGKDAAAVTLAAAAHVGLKFALVPAMGIDGAAAGTVLGELVLLGAVWYYTRDRRGPDPG